MTKVLYVEAAHGFGGSLTGLLQLVERLPADIVPILVTSYDPTPFVDLPARLSRHQLAMPAVCFHPRHWLLGIVRYYRHTVRPWRAALLPLIDELQPDLIHANNTVFGNLGAGLAGRRRRVPTVAHEKGFTYPGRLARWVYRRSPFTYHVAISHSVASHIQSLGVDPSRCTTIYDPVEGPPASQVANPNRTSVPVVAMHSMLTPVKGQDVFLRSIAEVRRRIPDVPFRAVIAGTSPAGESRYTDELKRLVATLKLDDIVEFPGHARDVYGFLRTTDVAVHASIHPEAFGRVVAEAMLCGVPSVVTAGGGPGEFVVDGVTGIQIPHGDSHALADALVRLIVSPELRQRISTAARQFALKAFDPGELAPQMVSLYREVLAGDGARGGARSSE